MIAIIFAVIFIVIGYCEGSTISEADYINNMENKKGCRQFSRQPFNERF